MASPVREARREDRRDAILEAAYACFTAEGYGATSMSTIAARLGGSKGTLYNYFKSKEELFDAFVRRSCARLLEGNSYEVPDDGDVRSLLVRLALDFLNHMLSAEAIAIQRLVVGEGERFPELARLFYEAGPKIGASRHPQLFQSLMQRGLLRRADPVLAAQQFKGLALSSIYYQRLWGVIDDPSPAERAAHAEAAADTFLRAYAPEA